MTTSFSTQGLISQVSQQLSLGVGLSSKGEVDLLSSIKKLPLNLDNAELNTTILKCTALDVPIAAALFPHLLPPVSH